MTEKERYQKGIKEISERLSRERAKREAERKARIETYENWWGKDSDLPESSIRHIKEAYDEYKSHGWN